MIQYFKTKLSKNGYNIQLIIDHEKKALKYGFFLGLHDSVTVSKKDIKELRNNAIKAGYEIDDPS